MRRLVFLAILAGCLESSEVPCGELICAEGRVCAQREFLGEQQNYCATRAEVDACDQHESGAACAFGNITGTCRLDVCVENICGNGVKEGAEACDDGNTSDIDEMGLVDGCSASCQSSQKCGNGIVDAITGETCDNGPDGIEHDGCSSGCRVETPRFDSLDVVNVGSFFGLAYDSDRHRTVMFGGNSTSNTDLQARVHGHWQRILSPTTPQSRETALAYDRDHHELVMYGSTQEDVGLRDTWTRDERGWHLREFAPDARVPYITPAGIVFDAAHHRVVMAGEAGGAQLGAFETWAWDGNVWTQIATSAPIVPRQAASLGYDEQRGVVVMFGGRTQILESDELWELDGDTWTQRPKQGSWPEGRYLGLLSYDPNSHTMVLVGGDVDSPVWEWNGSTWSASAGPSTSGAMITDLDRKRIVLVSQEGTDLRVQERRADKTWAFEGDSIPAALPPDLRASVAAATNPRTGEIVVFGGNRFEGTNGETHVWLGSWRKLSIASPPAREGASMVYDPIRDEMVMFGGCMKCVDEHHIFNNSAPPNGPSTFYNDTWTFKAGQWTLHSPAIKPDARALAAMAWDNCRERVILLGGQHDDNPSNVSALAVMWSWDGTSWVAENPPHLPPPLSGAAIAYDPASNNVIMFGGAAFNSSSRPVPTGIDATWIWNGTDWTSPALTLSPPPREQAAIAWNVARQRLELFAGDSLFGLIRNDLWEWNGTASQWKQVAVVNAPQTTSHVMVSLPDGTGVAVIGGGSSTQNFDYANVRTLRWDNDEGREEACVDTDFDGDGLVGCADPDCWYDCHVECPLATSCTTGPLCGDTLCNDAAHVGAGRATEDCASCPLDCGACN